ncbi:MAG TPA: dTMP kinase [Verrucomicrobiae bacterium]|nr:dTMP kinase [Verrucomicrobiae bacterium]
MKRSAKPGRLIVLEGGEGAGKSTQAAFVSGWLRERGRTVVQTREPGGSPLAEATRQLVLERWDEGIDATTEILLMFAARAAHLHAKVRPALERGDDVVCDRFVDATYAYQGGGRGMRAADIDTLAALVLKRLRPQLVLLLDVDPRIGVERVRGRGLANRFDDEALAFQARVRRTYLKRARADPRRYAVVDAGRAPASVSGDIARALERLK